MRSKRRPTTDGNSTSEGPGMTLSRMSRRRLLRVSQRGIARPGYSSLPAAGGGGGRLSDEEFSNEIVAVEDSLVSGTSQEASEASCSRSHQGGGRGESSHVRHGQARGETGCPDAFGNSRSKANLARFGSRKFILGDQRDFVPCDS